MVISNILTVRDDSQRRAKFDVFWQWMSQNDPRLQDAIAVTFYVDTVWTDPERRSDNPIERRVVYERQDPATP